MFKTWCSSRMAKVLTMMLLIHPFLSHTTAKDRINDNPVIIVGAGVAGLTAAGVLKEKGIPVLILEGRNRTGGRINTIEISKQQPSVVDMGAAWIDGGSGNRVYSASEEAGLKISEMKYANIWNLKIFDAEKKVWISRFRALVTMVKAAFVMSGLSDVSSEHLNSQERIDKALASYPWFLGFNNRFVRFAVVAFTEITYASRLKDINENFASSGYFSYDGYETGQEYMIVGGYKKFVEILQKPLSDDEIFLNRTVSKISAPESTNQVTVETSNGETFTGSHCILTVPLGVLKSDTVVFSPGLPESKKDAIDRIGFGNLEKIAMTFSQPFWRDRPDKKQNIFYIAGGLDSSYPMFVDVSDTAGSPTLVSLLVSDDAAFLSKEPDLAVKKATDILSVMFPETFQVPVDIAVSNWIADPFSQGSYSYPGLQTKPGDLKLISEPLFNNRLLFAGEATSSLQGYVEGAVISGIREAERILKISGLN